MPFVKPSDVDLLRDAQRVVEFDPKVPELVNAACDGSVGNIVDVKNASWTNDIGQAILAGYWEDPDYDPTQSAFCYVRVLAIPTPR
nr:DUF3604 domain-containing protein [Ruegeria lacuscaerulensis]